MQPPYMEAVMVIKDMIWPLDVTSKLNTSSASIFSKRKELIRVTKRRQIKDLRTETRATTADIKMKHEELMNSKQEEVMIFIM